jgi:hypothetical protein
MKPRHAAALALVVLAASMAGCKSGSTFWLLMTPPAQANGQDEPMITWSPSQLFRSSAECEQVRKAMSAVTAKQAQQSFGKIFKNLSDAQLDATVGAMSHSVCISSADPRLMGN